MGIERVFKVYTVDEATVLLKKHGEKAQLLAGGTDLAVQIREEKNSGSIIIDISDIKEIKGLYMENGNIVLGSLTTFSDIVRNQYIKENFRGLWKASKSIGSPQIRNMGTVGGNICNGSPAADIVPPLLALDATLILKSLRGERSIKLNKFYGGKGKTEIEADEILTKIIFSCPQNKKTVFGFAKLGLRNALAISRMSCSVYMEMDNENRIREVRIASGALGQYPLREYYVEELLKGRIFNEKIVKEASARFSEIVAKRLSGRSSQEYKKEAIKGVFKQAISGTVEE